MRRFLFLAVVLFYAVFALQAQGPELLVQQYDKYPYDLEFYRKWNVEAFVQGHLTNTSDRETSGRMHLDLGGNVYYQFTKTFGLSSGVHYSRISYTYALPADESLDRIRYLRFPLLLNVYPVKRVRLSLGGTYNWLVGATGYPPLATERTEYPQNTFVNSLGMLVGASYRIWKKFSVELQYRFQKRSHNLLQRETQNFQSISLGVSFALFHPSRRNP